MPSKAGPARLARAIGVRIRALRAEAGLTQEQLAWACDLNKGYMSRLEAGKAMPSVAVLCAVAKNLGLNLMEVVAHDPRDPTCGLLDAIRRRDRRQAEVLLHDAMSRHR